MEAYQAMTAATEPCPTRRSTERVRRHRERRRNRHSLFTVEVPQSVIDAAIERQLLKPGKRDEAWEVIQACHASLLSDKALDWLIRNGVIRNEQRADAAAILRNISSWLERVRP